MNPETPVNITKVNELAKFIAPGHVIVLPVFGYDIDTKSQLVGCEWAVKSPSGEVVAGNAGTLVLAPADDAVSMAQNFCNAQAGFLTRAMSKCVPATVEHAQAPLPLQSVDLPAQGAITEEPEKPTVVRRTRNRKAPAPETKQQEAPPPPPPPVIEKPADTSVMEVRPEDLDEDTGLPPEDMPQREEEEAPAPVPAPALPEAYADDPGEFVITYGRNAKKQLKDVTIAAIEWYATDLAAANKSNPEDLPLIEASRKYLKKLQTQNQ